MTITICCSYIVIFSDMYTTIIVVSDMYTTVIVFSRYDLRVICDDVVSVWIVLMVIVIYFKQ